MGGKETQSFRVTVPGVLYSGWSFRTQHSKKWTGIEFWDDPRAPKTTGLANTPAFFEFKPDAAYFFSVRADVEDGQLAGMADLAAVSGLQELDCHGCVRLTDAGLATLKAFPSLMYLCLSKCSSLTDAGFGMVKRFDSLWQL